MSCGKWEVICYGHYLWGISEPSFTGCSYQPGDACGGCEHCACLQGCDAVEVDSELTAHAVALTLDLLAFIWPAAKPYAETTMTEHDAFAWSEAKS